MLSTLLLPDVNELHLLEEISVETRKIVLKVTASQEEYSCPDCHIASRRVHSSYQRRLADLPCTGIPVLILWSVRRFFCDNPECNRATFVEQIPNVAARYARRTSRLHQQQTEIGFVVGGEPGAKLANSLEIPTSADTLLGMVRKSPEQDTQTPKILGVDDWAICKGKTYGTILIDLETRHPVDLLKERSTNALAKWLKAHPGIDIISRDRSNEYAKGASIGAPGAIQVADRFHLVKNLREGLELFLEQNRHCLRAAGETNKQISSPTMQNGSVDNKPVSTGQEEQSPTKAEKKRQLIRQKRLERYHEVVDLHARGIKTRTIARQLGLHRSTVRKYIQAGEFPEMAERSKMPVKLDPYLSYLEERWQDRYFQPDLVVRKEGETFYLEVEIGEKDKPGIEQKWENALAAGGCIYVVTDNLNTLRRVQGSIAQWSGYEGISVTLYITCLAVLNDKKPGQSPWYAVKEYTFE